MKQVALLGFVLILAIAAVFLLSQKNPSMNYLTSPTPTTEIKGPMTEPQRASLNGDNLDDLNQDFNQISADDATDDGLSF